MKSDVTRQQVKSELCLADAAGNTTLSLPAGSASQLSGPHSGCKQIKKQNQTPGEERFN